MKNTERTNKKGTRCEYERAPYIPDLSKAIDPYIGEYTYNEETGMYSYYKKNDDGTQLLCTCKRQPTPLDRKLQVELFRRWYMYTKGKKNKEVKIAVKDLAESIGLDFEKDSTKAGEALADALALLRRLRIQGTTATSYYDFDFLASIEKDKYGRYITVQIPDIFNRLLAQGKSIRPQRVDVIKISNSKYTQATWEWLISNGKSGKTPKVEFFRSELIDRLEIGSKKPDTQKKIISRALKEIADISGFKYKYSRKTGIYTLIRDTEPKKLKTPKKEIHSWADTSDSFKDETEVKGQIETEVNVPKVETEEKGQIETEINVPKAQEEYKIQVIRGMDGSYYLKEEYEIGDVSHPMDYSTSFEVIRDLTDEKDTLDYGADY